MEVCDFGGFAADAHDCAALTSGCLFTLVTEHLVLTHNSSLKQYMASLVNRYCPEQIRDFLKHLMVRLNHAAFLFNACLRRS